MISESEKRNRFEIAVKIAGENLPESIRHLVLMGVEHGYMRGVPVVILDEAGACIYCREELKGCINREKAIKTLVIEGVLRENWNNSDAPEFMECCRQLIYLGQKNIDPKSNTETSWWKAIGISNLDDLENPRK